MKWLMRAILVNKNVAIHILGRSFWRPFLWPKKPKGPKDLGGFLGKTFLGGKL
jgi:hypothetical protein